MHKNPLRAVLLTALFCVACKASNPSVPFSPPLASTPPGSALDSTPGAPAPQAASVAALSRTPEPIVARVGEERIYVSELLSTWMLVDGEGLRDMLGTLVTAHLVRKESKRLSISVDDVQIANELARALGEMEEKLQLKQPGLSLDEWIAGGLGLDPTRYRQGLRDDIESRLLAERIVRYFILSQDSADVSAIVCETEEEARAAMERVEAGEPFARVAAELSIDPSGKRGGRIPPVVRNDSALARLAFQTPQGELGGPLEEGGRWMVITTRELHKPLVGGWSSVERSVEASLEERPIEQPEYWLWKGEMNERHPADFEPLFDLIGEPSSSGSL